MPLTYVVLLFLTPITILSLLSLSGNSILKSNILSPLLLSYFVFSYLGFPLLFNNNTRYNYLVGFYDSDVLTTTFIYSTVSIFILVLSFIFTKYLLTFYKKNRFESKTIKSVGNPKTVLFTLIVSVLFLIKYITSLSDLAIIKIITGFGTNDIALARSEATNNLQKAWRLQFFPKYVIPFLSYYFFVEYKITKEKYKNLLFIITATISLFYGVMNAQKSPILFYIWSLIFLSYYIENKKLKLKTAAVFTIGSLLFLVIFLYLITGSEILSILNGISNRITAATITSAYFHVNIFPVKHPFLYGLSSPNPASIFPFESIELPKLVMLKMEGLDPNGVVGSAPGPFWSELYANFSVNGIIFGSFLIGAILALIEIIFNSLRLNSINAALFTLIVFQLREISTSGPLTFLFPLQIILVIMISILIQLTLKQRK